MAERITISFDVNKQDVIAMFQEEHIAKTFEEFLQQYFSFFMEIHIQNISHNMKVLKKHTEAAKIKQIAFHYLKHCIEKEDMEMLQIEVVKAFFKESFTNRKDSNIAIKNAFEEEKVIAIAENIRKKLRNQYFLASV